MTRKGTLHKTEEGWVVKIPKYPVRSKVFDTRDVLLTPADQRVLTQTISSFEGLDVHVELIDEFTHPQYYENVGWGDGAELAKIIDTNI